MEPPATHHLGPPLRRAGNGLRWLLGPRAAQGVSGLNYVNELKLFSVQSGKHSHYKAADTEQSDGHSLPASSYHGAANLTAGRRRGECEGLKAVLGCPPRGEAVAG